MQRVRQVLQQTVMRIAKAVVKICELTVVVLALDIVLYSLHGFFDGL